MPTLITNIDGKATEQNDGDRLVGGQTSHEPRWRLAWHHRTGRQRVVAGDIRTLIGRDKHARATATMALQGMLAQPFVKRRGPTLETLGAMPRLKRGRLGKAHELVVEHVVRRQQAGKLWNGPGGAIQGLHKLIPGGFVETKHSAIGECVLGNHPGCLYDKVSQRLIGLLGCQSYD